MTAPEWWPCWHGETCVVVASGPSASSVDLDLVRGRARVIAVNTSWRLVPWADALYAADYRWWAAADGCPGFRGLKMCSDERAAREAWGVEAVTVDRGADRFILSPRGTIGRGGGSSGFQAVNLAIQFECRRIVLVGFDASLDSGVHWHGPHLDGLNNPSRTLVRIWRRVLDGAARAARDAGVEIINASPGSALTAYPHRTLLEALETRC